MKKIDVSEVKNLVEYEKARESIRGAVIAQKRNRRVSVGDNLTFLFVNRETVLLQIQEMVRTERIVEDAKIQDEVDAYNALIPDPGELSATLFIELPDLHLLSQQQVRETVNRFQGLDREGVFLEVGDQRFPARFEGGHSKEEKMAAVHYLRFPLDAAARAGFVDSKQRVRLVVEHPNYKAAADLPPAVREEVGEDLA